MSVSPAQNGLNAPTGGNVVIEFDRPVDRATIAPQTISVFGKWSGVASGDFRYSNGDQTVTFDPARNFSAGELVMVALSDQLRAADGSALREAGYCWQFWTRVRPTAMSFALIATLSTNLPDGISSRPYGGVGTDFNGDGWLDLTMVNEDTADVRVWLNSADGIGTFGGILTPPALIDPSASPSDTADFDGDGLADLCITVPNSGEVAVLLGNGDGTFRPRQDIAVGSNPRGVAVVDVDGDGDMDIVNANEGSGSISLMLNAGGVFGAASSFDGGVGGERGLAGADMNNDGILDFAVGGYSSATVRTQLGNGDGTFTSAGSATASGGAVWMIVAADADGDGDADLAIANSGNNRASIVKNNGDGTLAAPVNLSTDPFTISVDFADFDGDGDLDLITSSYSGDWRLFLNSGGVYAFNREFDASIAASCAIPLDIDNDRDLDIALVDEEADTVRIYRNSGTGLAADFDGNCIIDLSDLGVQLAVYGCTGGACAGDADDDGDTDLSDLGILLSTYGQSCPA